MPLLALTNVHRQALYDGGTLQDYLAKGNVIPLLLEPACAKCGIKVKTWMDANPNEGLQP